MRNTMRLDKILGNAGIGTRKEVKELIKRGLVSVNGTLVSRSDLQIHPEQDQVCINGEALEYKKYIYLMMHKPAGVITATEDRRERTVFDILPEFYRHFDLSPVGRLDKDTEGLLILTNDGIGIHELLSPKKHVDKTYYVELEQPVKESDFSAVAAGISIGDHITKPAYMERIASDQVYLTIQEGKFHQVKRMFQALDNHVCYLKRVRMGQLELDPALDPGEVRALEEREIALLYSKKN